MLWLVARLISHEDQIEQVLVIEVIAPLQPFTFEASAIGDILYLAFVIKVDDADVYACYLPTIILSLRQADRMGIFAIPSMIAHPNVARILRAA
jgi:hypothetical protein